MRLGDGIYTEYSSITDQAGTSQPDSERELYELGSDPNELDNVADKPAYAVERRRLSRRLDRLRDCAGIAGCDQRVNARPYCE